jgi:hypothetical protein
MYDLIQILQKLWYTTLVIAINLTQNIVSMSAAARIAPQL